MNLKKLLSVIAFSLILAGQVQALPRKVPVIEPLDPPISVSPPCAPNFAVSYSCFLGSNAETDFNGVVDFENTWTCTDEQGCQRLAGPTFSNPQNGEQFAALIWITIKPSSCTDFHLDTLWMFRGHDDRLEGGSQLSSPFSGRLNSTAGDIFHLSHFGVGDTDNVLSCDFQIIKR